jgi:hypothetical protein
VQLASDMTGLIHATIAVYHVDLDMPLNEWCRTAAAQGFAWRPGSVSFALIEDYDAVLLEVYKDEPEPQLPLPARAIVVPFDVNEGCAVAIDDFQGELGRVSLMPGRFALLFETGEFPRMPGHRRFIDPDGWGRLTFNREAITEARIVVADNHLHPAYPLRMDARPA